MEKPVTNKRSALLKPIPPIGELRREGENPHPGESGLEWEDTIMGKILAKIDFFSYFFIRKPK